MIKSRIRVQSSERMATRRSSCDSRPGTVLRELRRRAAEIHNFKRQVRAAGPHFNLQTPSAPMIKPRILRPFFGKAADEAELMRRSAGRSRGTPKPGRAKKFHKHVAAEASADGSRKCPAKTSEKVRPFADVQSPNVARFSSFGNKKETLPCRRASFCLPPFRMFSALVARRKIVVSF